MSDGSQILARARAAIGLPDVLPSPLGDLHFFDGVPAPGVVRQDLATR